MSTDSPTTDAEKADAFRQAGDSWRVAFFTQHSRWQALFERFEIDPHGPDAIAHMAARFRIDPYGPLRPTDWTRRVALSVIERPEEFSEFAAAPIVFETLPKDFEHWERGHALLDEKSRIYREQKTAALKAGLKKRPRATFKAAATSLYKRYARACSRSIALREPLPELKRQLDIATVEWGDWVKSTGESHIQIDAAKMAKFMSGIDGAESIFTHTPTAKLKTGISIGARIGDLTMAIFMSGIQGVESVDGAVASIEAAWYEKRPRYAMSEKADCPLCVRRGVRILFVAGGRVGFDNPECDMCGGKGEVRWPIVPAVLRAAMPALDPVGRATDELLMLIALGPPIR